MAGSSAVLHQELAKYSDSLFALPCGVDSLGAIPCRVEAGGDAEAPRCIEGKAKGQGSRTDLFAFSTVCASKPAVALAGLCQKLESSPDHKSFLLEHLFCLSPEKAFLLAMSPMSEVGARAEGRSRQKI